jgi:hypothetical protein
MGSSPLNGICGNAFPLPGTVTQDSWVTARGEVKVLTGICKRCLHQVAQFEGEWLHVEPRHTQEALRK